MKIACRPEDVLGHRPAGRHEVADRIAEVCRVLVDDGVECLRALAAFVEQAAQVGICVHEAVGQQREVLGERAELALLVDLGLQDRVDSWISARVTSMLSSAAWMNSDDVSRIVERSCPVPSNAWPSSSTTVRRLSVLTETPGCWRRPAASWCRSGCGCLASAIDDPCAGRARVGPRLQVDELLTDRRLVGDDRQHVGGDLGGVVLDVEGRLDAVVLGRRASRPCRRGRRGRSPGRRRRCRRSP